MRELSASEFSVVEGGAVPTSRSAYGRPPWVYLIAQGEAKTFKPRRRTDPIA
jgi:hypothetical protein